MSRYTIVSLKQKSSGRGCRDLVNVLDKYLEKQPENCYYRYSIDPCIQVILSNGLSEDSHHVIYSELSNLYEDIKVISVLHDTPLTAIYKAIQLFTKTNYYYEIGEEKEYVIGLFKLEDSQEDMVSCLAKRLDLLYYLATSLINTGSLIIHLDLWKLIAVIDEQKLSQYEELKRYIKTEFTRERCATRSIRRLLGDISFNMLGESLAQYDRSDRDHY